jgi:N-acetylglucosamine PTS system EIICBA or EIICB component
VSGDLAKTLFDLFSFNRGEQAMNVANTSSQLPASQPASSSAGNRILAALQSLGRSLMLPVAVLPVAALLLRLGQPDLWQAILHNPGATGAPFIADAGGAIFNNLPMIFAVGIAFGLGGGEGAAALAGLVGFLIFNAVFNDFSPIGKGAHNNNMDVLSGILMGLVASGLYRRYHTIRLPDYLGFFGGRRFVPIITGLSAVVLGIIFGFIWPPVQNGLQAFGTVIIGLGAFGPGIYGFFNRLLIPLGLHHVLNSYIWFQLGTYNTAQGPVHGDLLRYFAGDPKAGLFESGFYPVMMFGLPAACLAMIRQARFPKVAAGILISAAFASFLTGITEPIEFAFIFVAPVLFVIHAFLTATSLFICSLLNIHMAFGFSAGLIDYLINFSAKNTTTPLLILVVGVGYAIVYYFVFSFFIKIFNLGTPGRGETSTGLSADWILPESQRGPAPSKKARANGSAVDKNDTLAAQVIEALAGGENIESVEGCITRLRLFIKDPALIDEPRLKSLGASGVMKQGKIVQVVMGMQSDDIASRMKCMIKEGEHVPASE